MTINDALAYEVEGVKARSRLVGELGRRRSVGFKTYMNLSESAVVDRENEDI